MNFQYYIASKLAPLANFFLSFNRKQINKNIYQVSKTVKLFLRKNTTDMYIVDEVFKNCEYDPRGNNIKQNSVIVDIGAHIGIFTSYAGSKAKLGKIYSFEPYIENFKLLQKNVKLNNFDNVIIFNLAISSRSGKMKLNISKSNTGGHSFFSNDSVASVSVKCITLAEIISKNKIKRINFLKIDIEGEEYDVILNTPANILSLIDNLAVEYHDYLTAKNKHTILVNYLTNVGFLVTTKQDFFQKLIGSGLIIACREN